MRTIKGTNGPDRLFGDGASEFILGLGESDTIRGGRSASMSEFFGGDGDDVIYTASRNDVLAVGGSGGDEFHLGSGRVSVFAGRGADNVLVGSGDEFLIGGAGQDTLSGLGAKSSYAINTDEDGYTHLIRGGVEIVEKGFETLAFAPEAPVAPVAPSPVVTPPAPPPITPPAPPSGGGGGGSAPPPPAPQEVVTRNPDDTVDPRGTDANGFQDFGTANGVNHASTEDLSLENTENYLRPHERGQDATSGPIRTDPDGVPVYQLPSGMQSATRTNASFDYGLITGSTDQINGISSSILIDGDLGAGTSYTEYTKQPTTAGHDAAYVITGTAEGFGGDATPPDGIAENSANFGFGSIKSHIGDGAYAGQAGLIDVIYRQVDVNGVAEDNHVRLQIGDGGLPQQ